MGFYANIYSCDIVFPDAWRAIYFVRESEIYAGKGKNERWAEESWPLCGELQKR